MRHLDDNSASRAVLSLSDGVGWWWNLVIGASRLIADVIILVAGGRRNDAYACLSFGTVAGLTGLAC